MRFPLRVYFPSPSPSPSVTATSQINSLAGRPAPPLPWALTPASRRWPRCPRGRGLGEYLANGRMTALQPEREHRRNVQPRQNTRFSHRCAWTRALQARGCRRATAGKGHAGGRQEAPPAQPSGASQPDTDKCEGGRKFYRLLKNVCCLTGFLNLPAKLIYFTNLQWAHPSLWVILFLPEPTAKIPATHPNASEIIITSLFPGRQLSPGSVTVSERQTN